MLASSLNLAEEATSSPACALVLRSFLLLLSRRIVSVQVSIRKVQQKRRYNNVLVIVLSLLLRCKLLTNCATIGTTQQPTEDSS